MAHSHVQRMLREAFELDELEQDGDGDYPFRHGTAMYYLTVLRGGHLVKVWSYAVSGLRPTAPVLREVNDLNARLLHSRAFLCGGHLQLEAFLPIESLVPGYLAAVCLELGRAADEVGQLLAAVHGGQVCFAGETEEV
jgi:hypothetical protein